jgi:hypothetical protein
MIAGAKMPAAMAAQIVRNLIPLRDARSIE